MCCCSGPTRHIHMPGMGERESYERSSCFMRECHGRAPGACGQLGLEGEEQGEGHGGREESEGMLMSCSPRPASKVNSDPHAACRQSKEVERVRREMELWRAEARLLGVSF